MIIKIRKRNYQYHGGQTDLIRDLFENERTRRTNSSKNDKLCLPVTVVRKAIMARFLQITGRKLSDNDRVSNAVMKNPKLQDGEIALLPIGGVPTFVIQDKDIMLIAQIVRAELLARPNLQNMGKLLQLKQAV